MALALRLGKTLRELIEQLSAEELFLWQAYNRESPISDVRGDVQTAILAAAVFQAQGAKVAPLDLLPRWRPDDELPDREEDGEVQLRQYLTDRADRLD
ncbi:DUF4035 domain-containing protein [Pseudomonas sp. OV546]|uniref:phage tail assembly protein T n=1 Tax=Pseudomonas sp. OV546 TaxID=1881063 RepID=UPI0008E7AE84|nr:DUF4035 domain-containing protein [Pseudomonas sp. OV546]SFU95213.1 Protein of unknown function [Pseudomonas sp. OV546]